MIKTRKANERGLTEVDWLKSYHTFSFGEYRDSAYMGFGPLRVINEDTVEAGMGFGTHQHREMEIISYVVSGLLEHKDSIGTGSIIKPGEIQRMSAGTGVSHSEFNASKKDTVHFLQIWIKPNQPHLAPSYEQKILPQNQINELILIGSPTGGDHAIQIHQDVYLYAGYLSQNKVIYYEFNANRKGWIQLIKGHIIVNNQTVESGDGVMLENETKITLECLKEAEFLLFDMG
jgi:redox-sensitive bicupin YhaK (pirin superfamily)